MLNKENPLSTTKTSSYTNDIAAPEFPHIPRLSLNPPDSPGTLSLINGCYTNRQLPFAETTSNPTINRTFTSNLTKRPRLISPSNSQFMRQNAYGATHRIYDKNGRPITPRQLIKINSHISLRAASSNSVNQHLMPHDVSHTSLSINSECSQKNRMQRLEGNQNFNTSNLPDLRYHKTQQNFMKHELSTSTFSNRRKSSRNMGGLSIKTRDIKKNRYDDLPTSIPDSSSDEQDLLSNPQLGETEIDQLMGKVRDHRGSIFVDDEQEIEEIIEVESTITSSYGGNYISQIEEETGDGGVSPHLRR